MPAYNTDTIKLKSTKSFHKLPVAHCQWQDRNQDGSDGPCAKWHGYDRSVTLEFSGIPDEHGWIVGFGDLKPVRAWLEYYFDHTAIAPASDPRIDKIIEADANGLVDLRVLPFGVSMEASSLFIYEHVSPFITSITDGRAYISRVECREHDSNSAFIEVSEARAMAHHVSYMTAIDTTPNATVLPRTKIWEYESFAHAYARLAPR